MAETRLYRQVHPSWIQEGRVTSQAFNPMPKDQGYLSVANSELTSAELAYRHHTEALHLASSGTWAVTVKQCTDAQLEAHEDPETEPVPDPAHAVIDFRKCDKRTSKQKADILAGHARKLGRLHPPQPTEVVSKDDAVRRLRDAGHENEANELDSWQNTQGNNQGWDGHMRATWPNLQTVVWPSN
jgi:hypothetical protein